MAVRSLHKGARRSLRECRVVDWAVLSRRRGIAVPEQRTPPDPQRMIKIVGAVGNNLRSVDVALPVGLMTCVTGVSGSGKSTLINDTLYAVTARELNERELIPHRTQPCTGLSKWIAWLISIRALLAARHVPIRRPMPVCLRRSANCFPRPKRRVRVATGRVASALTSRAGVAKRVPAMA